MTTARRREGRLGNGADATQRCSSERKKRPRKENHADASLLLPRLLAADNCHAQNGHSPLAAWHGGLEAALGRARYSPLLSRRRRRGRRVARAAFPSRPFRSHRANLSRPVGRTPSSMTRHARSVIFRNRAISHAVAAQVARRAPVSRDLFVNRRLSARQPAPISGNLTADSIDGCVARRLLGIRAPTAAEDRASGLFAREFVKKSLEKLSLVKVLRNFPEYCQMEHVDEKVKVCNACGTYL